jgi:hypothetical protein
MIRKKLGGGRKREDKNSVILNLYKNTLSLTIYLNHSIVSPSNLITSSINSLYLHLSQLILDLPIRVSKCVSDWYCQQCLSPG